MSLIACVAALLVTLPGGTEGHRPQKAPGTADNVRAFARLYGYVRWFHPSDEAASIDWSRFAVHGARAVRDATSRDDLRRRLEALFLPIAPTVRVYEEGERPPLPELHRDDTLRLDVVAWQHRGVGLTKGGRYRSIRLNRPDPLADPRGILYRETDATSLRGREVRFSADVSFTPDLQSGRTGVFLQVLGPAGRSFDEDTGDEVTEPGVWNHQQIVTRVADDATSLVYGVVLWGVGESRTGDIHLEVQQGDGSWTELEEIGTVLEKSAGRPDGWIFDGSPRTDHDVDVGQGPTGSTVLSLSLPQLPLAEPLFTARPEFGEATDAPLGRGLRARVPLALHSENGQTMPSAPPDAFRRLRSQLEALDAASLSAEDEAVRMGGVVILWNVLQHFYPYFDVVDVDWEDVLVESLGLALADASPQEYLDTLNGMLRYLDDAHAEAFHPLLRDQRGLPMRLAWIEGKVIALATDDSTTVLPGDELVKLDGTAIRPELERRMDYFSGSEAWRRHRALTHPLRGIGRGAAGSVAQLQLRRDGALFEVERVRDANRVPSEPRLDSFSRVADGVIYVDLTRSRLEEVEEHIDELANARGVVFDLRGYPRDNDVRLVLAHLSDRIVRSGYWNVPEAIYPNRRRVGWDTSGRWAIEPRSPRLRGEAVFLADVRSVSFTESVLGIVEGYGLGSIVGRGTAGVTGNVNPFSLPGGYQIGWTGMRYLKPDSTQHHVVGIQPTVVVERSIAGIRKGSDEDLQRAVKLILEHDPR